MHIVKVKIHRDKIRCYRWFHDQGRSSDNFENWVHFHGNSGHFIGLEEKKKEKSTILGVRWNWRDAMCVTGTLKHVKAQRCGPVVSFCGGLAVMAQEANSWDPGSIPGRDTSFDVPESSCLLSGPGLQLDSRYTGSRRWFGGLSGMPSAGEEDSVTGTLKHVKSSVARSGGIVLRRSSGYGAGG